MELKLKSSNKKILNISKKEKILLLVLLIVVLGFLVYKFVLVPQSNTITALKEEKLAIDEELAKVEDTIARENLINKEWETLNKDFQKLSSRYYPKPNQPDLIHILNGIIDEGKLEMPQMVFRDAEAIELDGLKINALGVSTPFSGTFDDLEIFLSKLRGSEKRLLVDQLAITKDSTDKVNGQVSFNAYAYGGAKAKEDGFFYQNEYKDGSKGNPFTAYDGYVESTHTDDSSIDGGIDEKRTLLADLENNNIYYMGTSTEVTGKVDRVNIPKYGKTSIRAEYFISTNYRYERAYVVLDDQNIFIKYPPQSIGVWAYSYGYSPVTVGMRFQDMDGKKVDMELERGVSWVGWKYISATPPQDINLYPLVLDRIYMELGPNRDDYGVLLFDRIEAAYPKDEESNIEKAKFKFHVVKPGDTLSSISKLYYGTTNKYIKIAKDNGISHNAILEVGKVLVIQN